MNVDSWQKGYAELSRQLANLKKENLAMKDELIKLRRTYEDQIDNLTLDNMPSVREIALKTEDGVAGIVVTVDETVKMVEAIAANQTTQGNSIASIRATSEQAANDANNAKNAANSAVSSVNILTETVTKQGKSIASIETRASELESSIASVAEVQTEQGENIAAIAQTANELGAEVAITAENVSNGAYIVARVNEDASGIKIKADKVEIEGVVTFSDLEEKGKTVINGANIKTGVISGGGANSGKWNLETGEFSAGNDNLVVDKNGNVIVKGKIESYSGNIGGWQISDTVLSYNEGTNNAMDIGAGELTIYQGNSRAYLGKDGNHYTRLAIANLGGFFFIVDKDGISANGKRGVTNTYSLGGGSITVENGIVVGVTEGGGGGGGGSDEPDTLLAPNVSINEDGLFTVNNPNGAGSIYYYTYWYDDYGGSGDGQTRTTSSTSVSGYVDDYPPGGGWVGVYAHVTYNGKTSPGVTDEAWFA